MRRTRALGALLVLALGLLGAPVALALWGRRPTHWAVLGRPDDGALLLAALTVLGWLAWLAFAASTVAEVVGLVARRHVRIPLLGRI
ncbi:MAG: peptidoglycan-binding protein LysM, partial [Actinobacteria bacterium]|nr:peptidoglycan-binding protein LysM [Actinomycetota bacterium]